MSWIRIDVAPKLAVASCLLWTTASSLYHFPHSLSYFNEIAGGPANGSAHLIDSNLDWGQDLFFLKQWYDEHPQARPLYLAYYGGFDPRVIGINYLPASTNLGEPGSFVISLSLLRGYRLPSLAGPGKTVDFQQEFRRTGVSQIDRIAFSMVVFQKDD